MSTANQVLPSVSNTEDSPGTAFAADGINEVMVIAGPASKGPLNTPTLIGAGDLAGFQSTFGIAGAAREALYALAAVNVPIVFLRLATATVAATHSSATVTKDVLSNFTSTLTGTPTDGGNIVILFTLGGTTGTGPIDYQVSTNGGVDFGATQHLLTGVTITVLGVTVALGSGKVITVDDTIAWWQAPASSSTSPLTITRVGTSTSVPTASGTPKDGYEVRIEFQTDFTVGTAGGFYRYTLDAGAVDPVYTPWTALGTSNTITLVDGPRSAETTGVTVTLGAGDIDVGDVITFTTYGPQYDSSGLTTGMAALKAWNGSWNWVRLSGHTTESVCASASTIIGNWASSGVYSWGFADCADRVSGEALATWSSRVASDFALYTSTRVAVAAGKVRLTCPVNGRHNRYSVAVACIPRLLTQPIQVDFGQFDLGPIGDARITDEDNVFVEHNANVDPSLNAMGFVTLRTWPGYTGTYPTKAAMLGPDNDIQRIPLRRVKCVADRLYLATLQLQAVKNFRTNKAGVMPPLVEGNLVPADIKKINRLGNDIQKRGVVSKGYATDAQFAINPTPTSLGGGSYKLTAELTITPLIYVDQIDGRSRFVSPTLNLALSATV